MTKLKPGDEAPNFSLQDQNGTLHSLSQYRGRWVLLYFYPEDDTPGCTKEACAIRDNFSDFQHYDAVVLGVSPDTYESHSRFAKKYDLPFTLLADPEKVVHPLYGADHRMSFLIDAKGKIAKIYETVKPVDHAGEVLEDLRNMQ